MSAHMPPHMTCQDLVEIVTDYVEGRMPPAQRTELEQHLVTCPACVAYIRQIRATIQVAGRVTEESIPEETKDRLLEAFRAWKKA